MSRTILPAPRGCRACGGLALVLLLAAVPGALAQNEDKPRLLVGQAPQKYVKADNVLLADVPNKDQTILWLRPNAEGKVYLFVSNPTAQNKAFQVRLVGPGGTVLQSSDDIDVKAGATTPVPAPAPAPAPKPAADEAAPKAPPAKESVAWLEGRGLPPQFQLRLVEVPLKGGAAKPAPEALRHEVLFGLLLPARYLLPTQPTYSAQEQRVSVTVEGAKSLVGEPCLVKMRLDLLDPATGAWQEFVPAEGVLQLPVTAGADNKVELFAKDARFEKLGKTKGVLTLTADGYDRAYRYEIDFGTTGGAEAVKPRAKAAVELKAPEFAVPGAPLPVRVGLDNLEDVKLPRDAGPLDNEVVLRLALGRWQKGTEPRKFVAYNTRDLEGHRFQRVLLNPRGADGAVAFRTEVHDWEPEVPTKDIFGKIDLRVEVLRKDGTTLVEAKGIPEASLKTYASVVLDGIRPSIVSGSPVDEELLKGRPLRVRARVKAPPSGLRSVAFFTGALAPDPKVPGAFLIPEGAARVMGKHLAKEDKDGTEVWEAALAELPTDKPAKVEVVVEAVSNAGLKDLGRFEVKLKESVPGAPGAGPQLGSIKGKVMEGMRAQAKLTVVLRDVMGAVKADATTNDAGEYEFKDLPPGPYVVSSAKKKSATKGETPVQVKAGKEAVADISLLR